MTRISLLPWRQQRRERQQRRFLGILVGVVLLAGVGVLSVHLYIDELIGNQQVRNQYLRDEISRISQVEKEIKAMQKTERSLLARLEAIKGLQKSRPDMVKAFDELVRLLPEDIFLTSLQTRGRNFTLKGNARVNNVVSDFMRELEDSQSFNIPALKIIENRQIANNVPASVFELSVNRK